MNPFLQLPPRPSTAISSPLGGIVHLIQREISDSFRALWLAIPRDSAQCSSAFRLATFTIRMLSSFDVVKKLDKEDLETVFYFLPLAIQLIDDDLSVENCNGITGLELADQREEYMEIVFDGRKVLSSWIHNKEPVNFSPDVTVSSLFTLFWDMRLQALDATSPMDYRIGEAFVKIMTSMDSFIITKSSDEVAKLSREARTANAVRSAALFAVLRSSILSNPVGKRVCNELVADSTGLKPQDERQDGKLQDRRIVFCLLTACRTAKVGAPEYSLFWRRKCHLDPSDPTTGLPYQESY